MIMVGSECQDMTFQLIGKQQLNADRTLKEYNLNISSELHTE